MITETPSLQKQVQPEGRFVNLIKQEFIKHAKEINRLEKDVDYKYYTKDEVDIAISEALADLMSTSADVIETLEDITETIDSKLDKGSPDYVKEVVVDGQNIVVTTGDNRTSINQLQIQIPEVPTKTSDLINDSNYISEVRWANIINRPVLSPVATNGSYNDLYDLPVIPEKTSELINDSGYITGVSWNEVTGKPNFATVATSGSYTDLSNKPTIPTVPTNVSAFNNDSGYITGVAWNDITNKPSAFPPSTHNHNSNYPIINRSGMTSIASNTDLNTLKTPGTYFTTGGNTGSTVHASLSNSPTGGSGGGFMMYVIAEGPEDNKYPKQIIYMYNGDVYERTHGASSWGEWHKRAYTDSDITGNAATATTATNANALNNLYTVSTRPTSANTCYADGKLRVYLATSKMTTGKPPSDAQILHLAWDNGKYDSQIAVSTSGNKLFWRSQLNSDNWGAWNTAAVEGHTHNYAGSSSVGGAATKVAMQEGAADRTRYIYFSFDNSDNLGSTCYNSKFQYNPSTDNLTVGKINGYTLGKSVPSDAVFTDTKVTATTTEPTSAKNWYPICSTMNTTATGTMVKNPELRVSVLEGTASAEGKVEIVLGNSTATGTAGNKTGVLSLYNNKGKWASVRPHAGDTENHSLYTPKAGGTLVVHTTDTAIGSASKPVYVNANGVVTECTSIDSSLYTNTTYSSMSATEATTGTATTARLITAKVLHDKIKAIVNQAMTKNNLTKI